MKDINITNVNNVTPNELAVFISTVLLYTQTPVSTPNSPLVINNTTADLLGIYANNLSFATELWSMIRAELSEWKNKKRIADKEYKLNIESQIEILTAKVEMLYRAIQALQTKYEATSRQVTILDHNIRH